MHDGAGLQLDLEQGTAEFAGEFPRVRQADINEPLRHRRNRERIGPPNIVSVCSVWKRPLLMASAVMALPEPI